MRELIRVPTSFDAGGIVDGRLRRAAHVAVVKSADLGQGKDAALLTWLDSARLGCILLEREMRPRAVV